MANPRNAPPPPRVEPINPASLGLPEGLTDSVKAVTDALTTLENLGINLLAPLTRIEFIPPGYRLGFRAVLFPFGDPSTCGQDGSPWRNVGGKRTNGTWYEAEDGAFALHKSPLRQLAAAAGLSWITEDQSPGPAHWKIRAVGRIRNFDGAWRTVSAMKDLDLSDTGPIVGAWAAEAQRKGRGGADVRILKAREVGGRMAESKAVNALIRDALGLRTAYPPNMARRPFVFPFLVWVPETAEARQLQAAVEYGVIDQVYGPASRGKVYAEAGTVIDGQAEPAAPAPRALPDNGPSTTPDFRAEAAKLAARERVEVRPVEPTDAELRGYCQAKGWPFPDPGDRRAKLVAHVKGKAAEDFGTWRAAHQADTWDADPDTNPDW